jgi:hypothetical protein
VKNVLATWELLNVDLAPPFARRRYLALLRVNPAEWRRRESNPRGVPAALQAKALRTSARPPAEKTVAPFVSRCHRWDKRLTHRRMTCKIDGMRTGSALAFDAAVVHTWPIGAPARRPSGGIGAVCTRHDARCGFELVTGTRGRLVARPPGRRRFVSWRPATGCGANACSFSTLNDVTYTAEFGPLPRCRAGVHSTRAHPCRRR